VDQDKQHDRGGFHENNRAPCGKYQYYRTAAWLARAYGPAPATALDIGPSDPPILELIDWVSSLTAIGLHQVPGEKFGLVFCLQALEQVPRPGGFLRKLLRIGELVVVAVKYKGPHDQESDGQPLDEVRLQRWARRRWLAAAVVEDEGGARLVAVFRGDEEGAVDMACDFGESDDERAWLDDLSAAIDAVRLPRRHPLFAGHAPARLFQSDPLRKEVTGTFGAYVVRALWNALGFDEHRKSCWRLEHKLVQARVFNRYLGGEFPTSWGVSALVRRGLGGRLLDALLAGKLFAKEALGHLSGDYGEAEATHDVLCWLLHRREPPLASTPVEEKWLVQERITVEREYRVHSLEDMVLPGMTFDRYGPCPVPKDHAEVNAYVASILARLPDALVGESLYGWDVARQADGRFRIIEANLVGFHPVFERGFQASGFFQYHPHGPPLLVELARHVASTYKVALELFGDWENEPNRHGLFLRLFRHYWGRPPVPLERAAARALAAPPPERLDAVLSLRAEELERFALLRESIGSTGSPVGTLWVAVPDADFAAIVASETVTGLDCSVVPESELIPEASEFPNAPPGLRRQVARLALVARTEGDFCLDLSPDIVCVRRFRVADLIRGGKGFYSRRITTEHTERYEQAEDLLGLRRSGWVHGTPPYLFSKRAVAELADYLERRSAGREDVRGSWRRFLLGRRGWSVLQVYFTFLEAFGLEERDYFPGEWDLSGNCIWSSEDWEKWDAAASFDEYASFYFSVVQVGRDVPAEAIRRRLAPHLGLAGMGGPRRSER
jgi:hypothetical protein